jgi:hypothetical protein
MVALERLRERYAVCVAEPDAFKTAATRGGSEMLVVIQNRRNRAGRRTHLRILSVWLLLSASASESQPASPMSLYPSL